MYRLRLEENDRTGGRSVSCEISSALAQHYSIQYMVWEQLFAVCDQTSLVGKTRRKDWISAANGAVLRSL
jgi:hypothetical protein